MSEIHSMTEAASRTLRWLESHLAEDGSFASCSDLACYYKAPALLHMAGRARAAHRVLDHVARTFLQPGGDLLTPNAGQDAIKSANPIFDEYWVYPNGWLVMAAQRLGRFDVSRPAWGAMRGFWHEQLGGGVLSRPYQAEGGNTVDIFMTAHMGMTALYMGDDDMAGAAGRLIARFVTLQPDRGTRFFLRMDDAGKLITEVPAESAPFHVVDAHAPGQLYFMIGYPIAFLGHLYRATSDSEALDTAVDLLAFAKACGEHVRNAHFAHKVAWGAAVIDTLTRDARHRELADAIVQHLLATQAPSGLWLESEPALTHIDQSVETALWLLEISSLLPASP